MTVLSTDKCAMLLTLRFTVKTQSNISTSVSSHYTPIFAQEIGDAVRRLKHSSCSLYAIPSKLLLEVLDVVHLV